MTASAADLDERLRRVAVRWGLQVGEPLAGGSRSLVFAARDGTGRDLVLKLASTAVGGAQDEAAALAGWADAGAVVTLLDSTPDTLLLLRARPGVAWPWPPTPDDGRTTVAADLLERLWAAPRPRHRFPLLAQVYAAAERTTRRDAEVEQRERGDRERGRQGLLMLPAAAEAAAELIATARNPTLLHGDFISKNVVSDTTRPSGWVALDPSPTIGDPAAEIGMFAAYHPHAWILPIAEELARALHIDLRRAQRWAAIWSVQQAAQAWREDQDELEQLIRSSQVRALVFG